MENNIDNLIDQLKYDYIMHLKSTMKESIFANKDNIIEMLVHLEDLKTMKEDIHHRINSISEYISYTDSINQKTTIQQDVEAMLNKKIGNIASKSDVDHLRKSIESKASLQDLEKIDDIAIRVEEVKHVTPEIIDLNSQIKKLQDRSNKEISDIKNIVSKYTPYSEFNNLSLQLKKKITKDDIIYLEESLKKKISGEDLSRLEITLNKQMKDSIKDVTNLMVNKITSDDLSTLESSLDEKIIDVIEANNNILIKDINSKASLGKVLSIETSVANKASKDSISELKYILKDKVSKEYIKRLENGIEQIKIHADNSKKKEIETQKKIETLKTKYDLELEAIKSNYQKEIKTLHGQYSTRIEYLENNLNNKIDTESVQKLSDLMTETVEDLENRPSKVELNKVQKELTNKVSKSDYQSLKNNIGDLEHIFSDFRHKATENILKLQDSVDTTIGKKDLDLNNIENKNMIIKGLDDIRNEYKINVKSNTFYLDHWKIEEDKNQNLCFSKIDEETKDWELKYMIE